MYTLYYSPGTCSLAVHAMLRHVGVPFELVENCFVGNEVPAGRRSGKKSSRNSASTQLS